MNPWLILNDAVLFLCTSMYLGTGWSLVLFSFPQRRKLTVENYYDQFVPQVARATRFFTWMTVLMIATAILMIVAERHSAYVIAPAVTLAGVLAATGLTKKFIFPYNERMAAHITDNAELQEVLGRWMFLNVIRTSLWTAQWVAMMTFFALHLR